ncbi:prolyl oligopeptidase family serine peptidase [Pedobacter glucosidilyticus]|uniref:glucuronyl esterase domain-containing protein n=1 Tax=Pedobacter glucosidilyticus TaxID=1122941 RepID=UPI0004193EDB|nr:prolyl oligopeptidase family serine peptidase [Pedobacter glucosidilyticus]
MDYFTDNYFKRFTYLLQQRKLMFSLLLIFFVTQVIAQQNTSWQACPTTVDKLSKSKPNFNYLENKVPAYSLPEVLTTQQGIKVIHKIEWEKVRRPELLELFTNQVYGRVPNTPFKTEVKIIRVDPNAMDGAATLKLIDITFSVNSKSLTIHLGLFIPNNITKPSPAFLMICNRNPDENIDFHRVNKSEFWPAEEVIARGYAVAAFYNGDVDTDDFDDFKNGIHGLLDTKRSNESWGTLAAWAWGASRCLDYLMTEKVIDPNKIAVIGHSRGAKAALWAGATDKRFAMVCSNEAGCGGASLARRRFGETVAQINRSYPHWFCSNYKNYNNNEDAMPVDMHQLMALIAPRALYVAAASDDLWGDPKGQYLALYHSLPAFQLYQKETRLLENMPALNTSIQSDKVAYHVRDGEHNLLLKDWIFFMDFADKVFRCK